METDDVGLREQLTEAVNRLRVAERKLVFHVVVDDVHSERFGQDAEFVVAACNGHVMAMGVFLMLSADYVIGSRGDFKVAANEVALGLTMPRVA